MNVWEPLAIFDRLRVLIRIELAYSPEKDSSHTSFSFFFFSKRHNCSYLYVQTKREYRLSDRKIKEMCMYNKDYILTYKYNSYA